MSKAICCLINENINVIVSFSQTYRGIIIKADVIDLPPGKHGFHIHRSGNLLKGCDSACDHWNPFNKEHGSAIGEERHAGDLGNIEKGKKYKYFLKGLSISGSTNPKKNLLGRSVIIHADEDDLGLTDHPFSKTTGNSGKRIICAIIGLLDDSRNSASAAGKTRKR
jgi:Cu-Zn family superoxide dismutase